MNVHALKLLLIGFTWLMILNLPAAGAPRAEPTPQLVEYDVPTSKSGPSSLTLGPDGNIWFTEDNTYKVGRVTADGKITEFDVPLQGPYDRANNAVGNIILGPRNELWFEDYIASRIFSMDVSGAVHSYLTGTKAYGGLVFASDGNLWFGGAPSTIGRMTPGGKVTQFPIPRGANGLASLPHVEAAGNSVIWFTVDVSTSEERLGTITTRGVAQSAYQAPGASDRPGICGVAVASDGSVWFAEMYLNRIARRSKAGTIREYPIPTPKAYACSVVAGPNGDVWFTESSSNKFGHITSRGKLTEYKIPTPDSGANDLALDRKGSVWITEYSANRILKASF